MRKITYVPQPYLDEAGQEKPAKFKGTVTLSLPSYKERIMMVKEMNFKTSGKNETELNEGSIDEALKVLELVEKHVEEVDVTRKTDKMKFTSLDDLGYDSDGSELINELGKVILGGTRLGNG